MGGNDVIDLSHPVWAAEMVGTPVGRLPMFKIPNGYRLWDAGTPRFTPRGGKGISSRRYDRSSMERSSCPSYSQNFPLFDHCLPVAPSFSHLFPHFPTISR